MVAKTKSKNDTVTRYFEAIDSALYSLDIYLREENSPLYQHEMTGRVLAGYILRLRHSFDAWKNKVAFAERFAINQAESGYPTFQNVLDLDVDARSAAQKLAGMPDGATLREDMVDYILLKKQFPAALQKALAQRLYFEEVMQGDVFQPNILPETIKVSMNPKTARPYYVTHWGAFDGSANLPMVYVAVLEDSSKTMGKLLLDRSGKIADNLDIQFPVGGLLNPDLAHQFDDFAEKNSSYGLTLSTIADNMDKDFEELHPKQLRRIVMGPFYNAGVTSHGKIVEKILDTVRNPNHAWLLTWTVQELHSISETPAKRGIWSSEAARQTYHIDTDNLECVRQGVSSFERHALVPHEAYQAIYASGKRDEIFDGYHTHVVSGNQVLRDF
ncbi:hypothetical protein ACFQ14_08320 [Pseudahrensia aquimaris]|uniref:Uncharacterized protein n=1 Tax=Pseudahrensia aquimaris TaxID=744461 RepID=A0ABW3FF90_9HYPH